MGSFVQLKCVSTEYSLETEILTPTNFLKVVRYSFSGPIPPASLSINYVAINKILEKLPPQLY